MLPNEVDSSKKCFCIWRIVSPIDSDGLALLTCKACGKNYFNVQDYDKFKKFYTNLGLSIINSLSYINKKQDYGNFIRGDNFEKIKEKLGKDFYTVRK